MDMDSLILSVRAKMSEIIQKPKMIDKLLQKPPFRFLHDTIAAVTTATGFGDGLYSGEELDSASISDRQAKVNYLEKIFNLVGICQGAPLDIRAAKVVAGLEPECTNQFLLALARVASDNSLDSPQAVARCLAGEEPGSGALPKKGGRSDPKAEGKSRARGIATTESKGDSKDGYPDSGAKNSSTGESKGMVEPSGDRGERGQSRGGARGSNSNLAGNDSSGVIGAGAGSLSVPNLDGEISRCDGLEATTQSMLGGIITRPKLSDKLLSKPPFRFLFDIVLEVTKVTGFAKKIIRLVGVQLNTVVQAKPLRIIGGYDPQNTNNFLQLLSVAAKHVPDSRGAVRIVLEQQASGSNAPVQAAPVAVAPSSSDRDREPKEEPRKETKRSELAEPKERAVTGGRDSTGKAADERREVTGYGESSAPAEDGDGDADTGDVKRSTRPTTARRRPPKVADGAKEVTGRDIAPVGKKTLGIMADGQADDDDDEGVPEENRLADDVRAGSKNAAPTEIQSKLVKDIMSRQAEQEAARKASNEQKEAADESKREEDVRGIRIGKLRKTGAEKGGKGPVTVGTNFGEGDMERLRLAIQVLVQHTGPLGTCMDYVQEDISLMTGELQKWGEECRKYEAEMEIEKKKSSDLLRPLQVEYSELEEQLLEQKAKISSTKASIARNDERIQQILKLVASS